MRSDAIRHAREEIDAESCRASSDRLHMATLRADVAELRKRKKCFLLDGHNIGRQTGEANSLNLDSKADSELQFQE